MDLVVDWIFWFSSGSVAGVVKMVLNVQIAQNRALLDQLRI
jgi:hypothetical protein